MLRNAFMLLVLAALGFSTAPSWVVKGLVLEYTVGTDTVTFTVMDKDSEYVTTQIKPKSAPSSSTAKENASGIFGQFWHDSAMLAAGQTSENFQVSSEGTETFAGKEYETVTLTGTEGGAESTKIYEKKTGLLLKRTVSAVGAPTVTLVKYSPPSVPEAPKPPAQNTTKPANQTTPSLPPSDNQTAPAQQPAQPEQPDSQQPDQYAQGPSTPEEPSAEKKPITDLCCPSAFLLLLLGFMAVRQAY